MEAIRQKYRDTLRLAYQNHQRRYPTYPTQVTLAKKIYDKFQSDPNIRLLTLIAPPQWGKTGCVCEFAVMMCLSGNAPVSPTNVYTISGMNDTDWNKQTVRRVPGEFKNNVYHRGALKGFVDAVKDKTDILVIIDECHIGGQSDHVISNRLKEAGILNIASMMARNIRVLLVSATPDAAIVDSESWGTYSGRIIAPIYPAYVSFKKMMAEGRIKNIKNIRDDVDGVFDLITTRWGTEARYHILRSIGKDEFNEKFETEATTRGFKVCPHNCKERLQDIDDLLQTPPSQPTLIIIKGLMRAAKTLNDIYIGVVIENSPVGGKSHTSEVQGLIGRLCGPGKQCGPRAPVAYGDIDAIHKYIELIEEDFDYADVEGWRSSTLVTKGGVVHKKKQTIVHASNVVGLNAVEDDAAPRARGGERTRRKAPFVSVGSSGRITVIGTSNDWLTSCEKLTKAAFKEKYTLTRMAISQDIIGKFRKVQGADAHISLKTSSAKSVSNLENYFERSDTKPYQVIALEDSDDVHIIKRNVPLFEELYDSPTPDGSRVLYGHNYKGEVVKYITLAATATPS